MNCSDAREHMAMIWDLPAHHPIRLEFMQHIQGCKACRTEYEEWTELYELIPMTAEPIPEKKIQSMHTKVMDRIYKDNPNIQKSDVRTYPLLPQPVNHRLSIWISACLALFLCSVVFMTSSLGSGMGEVAKQQSGIVPTAVASSSTSLSFWHQDEIRTSGIMEPLVVGMKAYPEHWMILSLIALGVALFSLRRIHHGRAITSREGSKQ
ncbi:anti-sigma factor family protein [Paenibacillus shunpengii]|uniref:Anti-sigma factor family protein n=1 Tax=Paenibacillus shunpengii TaxID=2054424 RepID=A0ABW5SP83_9BACL|nr:MULTISPECIES: hypothetical protein [unclassified Paenibacillus]OMC68534.1 hypothetical protein BK126_11930 [Paenibacillus sp. FSL H7-0326]SDW59296.1 hypothetical protein SAMN05518848_102311 [Paenibacillus sp. PDC88]